MMLASGKVPNKQVKLALQKRFKLCSSLPQHVAGPKKLLDYFMEENLPSAVKHRKTFLP